MLVPYQRDSAQNSQEIRISKSETNSNDQNIDIESVLKFSHSDFGFVSDFAPVEFVIGRDSYLVPALPVLGLCDLFGRLRRFSRLCCPSGRFDGISLVGFLFFVVGRFRFFFVAVTVCGTFQGVPDG